LLGLDFAGFQNRRNASPALNEQSFRSFYGVKAEVISCMYSDVLTSREERQWTLRHF
jgi:hypothetical protein